MFIFVISIFHFIISLRYPSACVQQWRRLYEGEGFTKVRAGDALPNSPKVSATVQPKLLNFYN
jgi:hypothetical protein